MRLFHVHVAMNHAGPAYRTWLVVARSDREALRFVPRKKSAMTVVSGVDDVGEARDSHRQGVIGWMAGKPVAAEGGQQHRREPYPLS